MKNAKKGRAIQRRDARVARYERLSVQARKGARKPGSLNPKKGS